MKIAEELRERLKLRYMGDCKCGHCALVPDELVSRAAAMIEQQHAALEKIRWLEGVNPTAFKIALEALRGPTPIIGIRQKPNDPMTLVERLRNPQWIGTKIGDAILDPVQTRKDMDEAADVIERLQRELIDANSYADLRASGGIVGAP